MYVCTCGTASINVDAIATDQGTTVYTIQATDAEQDPLEYAITSSDFYVGKCEYRRNCLSGLLRCACVCFNCDYTSMCN